MPVSFDSQAMGFEGNFEQQPMMETNEFSTGFDMTMVDFSQVEREDDDSGFNFQQL